MGSSRYQTGENTHREWRWIKTNIFGQCYFDYTYDDQKTTTYDCTYKVKGDKYLFTLENNEENSITCTISENGMECPSKNPETFLMTLKKTKPEN